MAGATSNALYDDLQTLFETGTLAGLTDRQLLDRFAYGAGREAEAAFAVLVGRHGPTVWRVCRQTLGNAHDAEDMFQATFLVLARRASAIRRPQSLGSWLHGVALRASSCARRNLARRRRHERGGSLAEEAYSVDETRDDTSRAVHEEVDRLPGKIRDAVVLCYFEGLTHEQTASRLGCPVGTVHSRLASAKERLESSLKRRQVMPSAVLLRILNGSHLDVPKSLLAQAVRAAVGSQNQLLSPLVSAVIHELTRITIMSKISLVFAGLAATLMVVAASDPGVAAPPQGPVRKAGTPTAVVPPKTQDDDPEKASDKTPREELSASARVLMAKLDAAMASRVTTERLFKQAIVGADTYERVVNDVTLVVAQIESKYDELRDEVELLEAQLEICQADLKASIDLVDVLHAAVAAAQSGARQQWTLKRAELPVKQAEVKMATVRLRQAKQRLEGFNVLMKKVKAIPDKVTIPAGKAPAPPAAPLAK